MRNTLTILGLAFVAIVLALSVLATWALYPTVLERVFNVPADVTKLASLGQFGDSFGSLNALFSGLAFLGIAFSLFVQFRELKSNQDEIKNQNDQLALQNNTLLATQFETTFFNLLRLHHDVVSAMHAEAQGGVAVAGTGGRLAFAYLYRQFLTNGHLNFYQDNTPAPATFQEDVQLFFNAHGDYTIHYFKNLFEVLAFIHRSAVANKGIYASMLRAQLSDNELGLILLFCGLSSNEKYRHLAGEYALLKELQVNNRIDKEFVRRVPATAFGSNDDWHAYRGEA